MAESRRDFCMECRKETSYILQKKNIERTIRDRRYTFEITEAVCTECGKEMGIPGLLDRNAKEIDEQYRAMEGLVSISDIERLMKLYSIGKAPLSLALGFGEVTITRYLEGQMPSKTYSDIIRSAISSPAFMKQKLMTNGRKLTAAAFRKAFAATESLERLFAVSPKMLGAIALIFDELGEVTPLMLQKLLYFSQGVHSALYKRPLFEEDCMAWVHGPVYSKVYELFQDFRYNPIEDERFALIDGMEESLSDEERGVLGLVIDTFGLYGGKVLESITHREDPWLEARKGHEDTVPSRAPMPKESIMNYFTKIHRRYGIDTEEGLRRYIGDMLHADI